MFDEKFEYAIKIVLKHEGGYSNDSVDPGGETKYGISKRSYPMIDIKNLTIDKAKTIYYYDFWLKGRYYKIIDIKLAAKTFDAGVNMGTNRANKLLQSACNNLGSNLLVDGLIGPNTLNIVNSYNSIELLDVYRDEMYKFYTNLIKRRPSLVKYVNGWRNRAYS